MKSNSNFNITKVTVDPVSQEITNLEINGKPFESGGSNLQTIVYDSQYPLDISALFPSEGKPGEVEIKPDTELGYDGIEKVTIQPNGLTGLPTDYLVGIFVASNDDTDYKLIAFQGVSLPGILMPEVNSIGWHYYNDLEVTQDKTSPIYTVTISGITYGCDNVNTIRLFDSDITNA